MSSDSVFVSSIISKIAVAKSTVFSRIDVKIFAFILFTSFHCNFFIAYQSTLTPICGIYFTLFHYVIEFTMCGLRDSGKKFQHKISSNNSKQKKIKKTIQNTKPPRISPQGLFFIQINISKRIPCRSISLYMIN